MVTKDSCQILLMASLDILLDITLLPLEDTLLRGVIRHKDIHHKAATHQQDILHKAATHRRDILHKAATHRQDIPLVVHLPHIMEGMELAWGQY